MAKVYLAVGHGISTDGSWDCGCVDGKYTEAALMLNIAKYTVQKLRANGITVITDYDTKNDRNMTYTVRDANAAGADIYISLHCDWNQAPSGTYPIIYPGSSAGRKLANALNSAVMSAMKIGTRGILERDDYEVSNTDMPACIFETGSIRKDINILLQSKKYGESLTDGVIKYFGKTTTTTTKPSTTTKPTKTTTTTKKIAVDGEWGMNTTKATQKILKSGYVDGIVSGQLKKCQKYLPSCLESSWEFDNGDGSPMIKKLQNLVGAKADGYAGENTVAKLQTFLNKKGFNAGSVDSICGEKTVKAWQKYLNSKL
jgi:hypothetical protein